MRISAVASGLWTVGKSRSIAPLLVVLALAACHLPEPYRTSPASTPAPVPPNAPPVRTQPGTPPTPVAPAEPLPPPVVREHKLSPASQALVAQAQKQTATGNYPVA